MMSHTKNHTHDLYQKISKCYFSCDYNIPAVFYCLPTQLICHNLCYLQYYVILMYLGRLNHSSICSLNVPYLLVCINRHIFHLCDSSTQNRQWHIVGKSPSVQRKNQCWKSEACKQFSLEAALSSLCKVDFTSWAPGSGAFWVCIYLN